MSKPPQPHPAWVPYRLGIVRGLLERARIELEELETGQSDGAFSFPRVKYQADDAGELVRELIAALDSLCLGMDARASRLLEELAKLDGHGVRRG